MLTKIFLSILLLLMFTHTCSNQLKIITTPIFKQLPDNFNFELNGIQTVKPNLKIIDLDTITAYLELLFGNNFVKVAEKYMYNFNDQVQIFDEDILSKLQEFKNKEEMEKIFYNYVLSKFKIDFGDKDYKKIRDIVKVWLDRCYNETIFDQ